MIEVDVTAIAVWAVVVISGYHLLDYLFPKLTGRFRELEAGRRRYVIKNLLKSGLLLVLGVLATPGIYHLFYHHKPDNEWIHTVGILYAIPDVYSLWWVRGMLYQSTVYHHVSVAFLATIGLFLDHNIETHWIAMLVYAYLSMWTGVVNFYLGARFLLKRDDGTEDWIRMRLAYFALSVYVTCCAANWLYQLHTVMLWIDFRWTQLTWANLLGLIAYCAMLSVIIKDDLILMRKLAKECSPYLPPATVFECAQHFKSVLEKTIVEKNDEDNDIRLLPTTENKVVGVTTEYTGAIDLTELVRTAGTFHTPYRIALGGDCFALFTISLPKRCV